MTNFFRSCIFLLVLASPAMAYREIGEVEARVNTNTIPVRVSADQPILNGLAQRAFNAHGRYHVVASGYAYDIHFTAAGPNAVQVTVTKGIDHAPVFSQVAQGTNARNALLRAADLAVERTNGKGLRGFFASKIVFIGTGTGHKEVYVSDLFFTEARRITSDRAIAMTPRWAPDGQRVLYTSFLHGFPDIYLLDLASYRRTTFESFRGTNSGAHFSPDGSRVAMVLSGSGSPEVWVSDSSGHGLSRKTHTDSAKSSPCWSPDGSQIVFAQEPGPQLYVMPASGGYPRRIAVGLSSYCAEPDWSRADPDKIAFTARVGSFQIAVYDARKGRPEVVSHAGFDGVEPCWLADGRHLVYTARDRFHSQLCILDTESGKSTPISPIAIGSALQANVWYR